MKQLIFSTGNPTKYLMGKAVCDQYDIQLTQDAQDIDEVQSEDIVYVAKRKAEAAFALTKQPVIISDDAWEIPGINGFPGTYAKSVNTWFTADDYIRLTKDLADRSIHLVQTLVYQDASTIQLFRHTTTGTLLREPRGIAQPTATIMEVVSLREDGMSIAQDLAQNNYFSGKETLTVWHEFAQWFIGEQA